MPEKNSTADNDQAEYVADCPDCDWSETAESPLGAYFAGRSHYFDAGQEHVPETEERSVDTGATHSDGGDSDA